MVVGKFENIFDGEISIPRCDPRFMEISPIRIISFARLNRKITEISQNACPTYPAYRTTSRDNNNNNFARLKFFYRI